MPICVLICVPIPVPASVPLVFVYWFFTGPALLLALLSLRGERKRAEYVSQRLTAPPGRLPPASVIVPVKGNDEGLRENLAALGALDYPDYELIIAARSASDIPVGVLPARARIVLSRGNVSGNDGNGDCGNDGGHNRGNDSPTSEKIQNLLAAVRATRKRSEILAFADSDGRVTVHWLCALVAPLSEPGVGASTGYRWFLPDPPDFWSLLRGVWDAVAAGTLGAGDNRFAWGGAMAMRKELFFEVGVPEAWRGELSDDYALSEAIHAAGLAIAYAPGALTPCLEHTSGGRFFGWIRRQMAITRLYAPRLWWPGLIAHIFYCGGMAASAIASVNGHRLAEWALIAQLSPGMLKGLNRATLAKAALPDYESWFKRHSWVHAIWVPLGTWVWLFALVSSAVGTSIEWRGRRYPLKRGRPSKHPLEAHAPDKPRPSGNAEPPVKRRNAP